MYAQRRMNVIGTSGETDKEDYREGFVASYITKSNSACPKKKFKEKSPVILEHSVNMTTRHPKR